MNKDTPAPIATHATLEALLDFPHDPLTASELADVLNVHAVTVRAAMRNGTINSAAQRLRNLPTTDDDHCARRVATKADIIAWLWGIQTGERQMMRAVLVARAPGVLRVLEAPAPATKHATPRHNAPRVNVEQMQLL